MTDSSPVTRRGLLHLATLGGTMIALDACSAGPGTTGSSVAPADDATSTSVGGDPGRLLLVWFSRPGENYHYGGRRDLDVGNTQVVARTIRDLVGCDTYRIVEQDTYPRDYDATVARNVEEQETDARPAIAGAIPDVSGYDGIILGSPVWNVRPPRIVHTFLDSVDLSGKTLHPFTTHAMSGLGRAPEEYADACPGTRVAEGLAVQGEEATRSTPLVRTWLRSSRII